MFKEAFIQPRFDGPRFDEHTLPVSVAQDLAAYEELVTELAKHLYREKNADRKRVPKGFADDFQLHFERIEDGSAKPLLSVVLAGSLLGCIPDEFVEAKDLINQVIAAPSQADLPAEFPKEFYRYFNRIGRSLGADEVIEWTPESADEKTVLSADKRKRLVLAEQKTYEADIEIVALVEELDTRKKTGILRTLENEAIPFDFGISKLPALRAALGSSTDFVRVEGTGVYDVNDRLGKILEIESLEVERHSPLIAAIEDLSQLESGWLEGSGEALDIDFLSWLEDIVTLSFPSGLEYPSVAPTEEGNVSLEWIRPRARIELEVNREEKQLELYATDLETDRFVEEIYPNDEWASAYAKVTELLAG